MSDFKIRVKVGDVEIEYTDNVAQSDRPICVNAYFVAKSEKRTCERLFETIELMTNEAAKLHQQMYTDT